MVVKDDADTVGFVLWQHLLGVDFGLKAPGDSDFTWTPAPVCGDVAPNLSQSAAWCPFFDSSLLGGEGKYDVQFRAVDTAGNETVSQVSSLLVDDTGPTAASSHIGNFEPAVQDPNDNLNWTVSLSGTVGDPNLSSGHPGSGVNGDTVAVSLVDGTATVVGGTSQRATVSGGVWSVNFAINGTRPIGPYTVRASVEDNVGNRTTVIVGGILLDGQPPTAQMYSDLSEGISAPFVVNGTIIDQPDWHGAVAQYHFEDPPGSTTFLDTTIEGNDATCANCPTIVGDGVFGQALDFDGVNDELNTPSDESLNIGSEMTISLWVKPDTLFSGVQRFVTLRAPEKASFRIDGAGQLHFFIRLVDGTTREIRVPNVLVVGQYQHVAASYDGATMRVYHKGVEVGSLDVTASLVDSDQVRIGQSSEPFGGMMDEVTLFDRALTPGEIYALAQNTVAGISRVDVVLDPFDFDIGSLSADDLNNLNWDVATLQSPGANLSAWSYPISGNLEGFYQLRIRGEDVFGNTSRVRTVWRGVIDTEPPRIDILTVEHLGGGSTAQTRYEFNLEDRFLDPASLAHPCGGRRSYPQLRR